MVLNRRSLREQIRDTVLQRIGSGELAPGERIMEVQLAKELAVSAIPVREALRELVAVGALESASHRGVWVRKVKQQERIEGLHVRSALESLAVSLAVPALQKQRVELRQLATTIVAAARAGDFVAFQKQNQSFHRTIVESANNRVLLKFWDMLAFEVGARPILDSVPAKEVISIAREHEQIVGAIEAGDVDRAASLLAAHSMHLVEALEQNTEIGAEVEPLRLVTQR